MLELLLAGSMLVHTDITALQSSKLPPNATNAHASILVATPRVLDRATFATYPASATPPAITILTYQFDPGEIGAGSQIHFKVGGTFLNDSGGPYLAGAQFQISSGTTSQFFGAKATASSTAAGANSVRAWETDCTIAASISGADGQYLPNLKVGSRANQVVRPNSVALSFTNVCKQFISDASVASSPDFGGLILNAAGNGSIITSTVFQQNFSLSNPIRIDVLVRAPLIGTGLVSSMTVQMGYMEGL